MRRPGGDIDDILSPSESVRNIPDWINPNRPDGPNGEPGAPWGYEINPDSDPPTIVTDRGRPHYYWDGQRWRPVMM